MKVYLATDEYAKNHIIVVFSSYQSAFNACLDNFKTLGYYEEAYKRIKEHALEGSNIERILLEDEGYLVEPYEVM